MKTISQYDLAIIERMAEELSMGSTIDVMVKFSKSCRCYQVDVARKTETRQCTPYIFDTSDEAMAFLIGLKLNMELKGDTP